MPKFGRLLVSAAIAGLSLPALAVLPQAGLWTIGQELNGEPGRGIQLDRQSGNTIVLSYFGYRADGTSMFLQAGGKLAADGKTFTGDLKEYKGGAAIAAPTKSAVEAANYGAVTVKFDSTVSGKITLPGEAEVAFTRFTFEDFSTRLNHQFDTVFTPLLGRNGEKYSGTMTMSVKEGKLTSNMSIITDVSRPFDPTVCTYVGDLVPAGTGFSSSGSRTCDNDETTTANFRFEDLTVNEYGALSGRTYLTTPRNGETVQLLSGMCMSSATGIIAKSYCGAKELGLTPADIAE